MVLKCYVITSKGIVRNMSFHNILAPMRKQFVALLCLLPLSVAAQDNMNMQMAASSSHTVELGASASFDSHGRLWVVDAADKHVRLRYSDDFGTTFSAPVVVNAQPEQIYDRSENRPKLAIGTHGELYVTWSQSLAKPWTGFVRFARSMDDGAHFSVPVTVHVDRSQIGHTFDALAVDGKGRVVVAWIDKRDAETASAQGKPYLGAALYYSWSNDQGRTFAPERKLLDHSCDCCRIELTRTPKGDIAAFFRSIFGDNIRDHAYAVLHADAQPDKIERATFDNWQIAACPRQGPGLAIAADGTRHAVWYVAKDTPTIWYGQLDPGHPPHHAQAIASAGASHADVAVDGSTVWVTWNQVDAQGYTLMLRRSSDAGTHFDNPKALATTASSAGSPQLLLWHDHAYVAWNTAEGFRLLTVGEH